MSELREAAERYRDSVYEESEEGIDQCFSDRCKLADFAVNRLDPTPLADLTDEQWRAEGFDNIHGNWCLRMDRDDTDIILMINPDVTIDLLDEIGCKWEFPLYLHGKTLGQLRHLIAALGGGE